MSWVINSNQTTKFTKKLTFYVLAKKFNSWMPFLTPTNTGNNLKSKGSTQKNKKRALRTVNKGHFVWLLILRYLYLKTIFGIFRSK